MRKFIKHLSYGAATPSKKVRKTSNQRAKTIIFEIPEYHSFISNLKNAILGHMAPISLSAGVATCHPEDEFTRKVGIAKATEAMKPYLCTIANVNLGNKMSHVRLVSGGNVFVVELNHEQQVARILLEG